LQTKPLSKVKSAKEKRRHEDDIPPPVDERVRTQYYAYKQLKAALKCEAHRGHCFVDCSGGCDNHRRLDHQEMTMWAKKIVRIKSRDDM
jgi:hypothetical protein